PGGTRVRPTTCEVAFKEWAVTVDDLGRGEQAILLRKGGIHEERRHFELEHERFLFYPGYLHQKAELLKPEYRPRLPQPGSTVDESEVTLGVYAEVADAVQITAEDAAAALDPFHIWSADYAQKRINWKPRWPLNVLILRCYRMRQPVTVQALPEYGGCMSWVTLAEPAEIGERTPAMTDAEFQSAVSRIREVLEPYAVANARGVGQTAVASRRQTP
ncbi:MAG: DUF1802 family protein, partial [Chloroflexota bacterium]